MKTKVLLSAVVLAVAAALCCHAVPIEKLNQDPSALPPLAFQDLNIVQVTDVHSWLSGHRHEPLEEADLGDTISFVQHLQDEADKLGKDLFFFDSGDIVEGTGLSDASPVHGQRILPILQQVPYNAITIGNHELYHNETVWALRDSGFIASWKGRYVTSNVFDKSTGRPLGATHTMVEGKHGTRVLVMGFLYDMLDACAAVEVQRVEEAVLEPWFDQAMSAAAGAHAIVVLAHMDVVNPLLKVILSAIRARLEATPVVFLTGHTHYRGYAMMDALAVSMESGKYHDTVGFLTAPLAGPPSARLHGAAGDFTHMFITPHVPTYMEYTSTDASSFTTPIAATIKQALSALRAELGLDRVVGCAPRRFDPWLPLAAAGSLWEVFLAGVAPSALFLPGRRAVFVGNTGTLRYSLFAGPVAVDDTYTVSPFKDLYQAAPAVPGEVAAAAVAALLGEGPARGDGGGAGGAAWAGRGRARTSDVALVGSGLPRFVASAAPAAMDPAAAYDIVWVDFDTAEVTAALRKVGWTGEIEGYRQDVIDDRSVWESFVSAKWPCAAPA